MSRLQKLFCLSMLLGVGSLMGGCMGNPAKSTENVVAPSGMSTTQQQQYADQMKKQGRPGAGGGPGMPGGYRPPNGQAAPP